MKTQFNNRAMIVITACSLGLLSVFASAGQDESQRYLTQQVIKTKQQVQAAGATMVAACKQMMGPSRSMMGRAKAVTLGKSVVRWLAGLTAQPI